LSWHFTIEKITQYVEELSKARIRARRPLDPFLRLGSTVSGDGYLSVGESYRACEEMVHLTNVVRVPEDWTGAKVFVALELAGAETLVRIDGRPAQAIDNQHHDLLLADPAEGGREYGVRLESYTGSIDAQNRGSWTGSGDATITGGAVQVVLKTAELQWIDRMVEGLYFDMLVATQCAKAMDANSLEYVQIVSALDGACRMIDFSHTTQSEAFYSSAEAAREHLRKHLYDGAIPASPNAPTLWSTGHAHIDTAWLWRVAHARKKVERTFTTALALMEQYPEYHFTASQAQQYAYLKEDNPEVYAGVKEAVHNGRWEPVGGMWVESDCNVVSGESLVRQFLYGTRFFKDEFGTHSNVVWLPDVFGYSAAFPQIIRKCGMKYFMTIKIFWNQVNKPPYQTFEWEGIDGTTVLTHFSPIAGYNSMMCADEWRKTWTEYKQKHVSDSAIYIYGFGDGGGGPTRSMLEAADRAKAFPNTPKVRLSTAEAFFEDLDRQATGNPMLPRWVGELYLEYHRGTYTSQAYNKKMNRRSEIGLQTAEQLASLALTLTGAVYPGEMLDEAWKLTLLNQFHDIIPGSSIRAVYEDSKADYGKIMETATIVARTSLLAIADAAGVGRNEVIAYNPLSWERADVALCPAELNVDGQNVIDFDGSKKTLVPVNGIPALGFAAVEQSREVDSGIDLFVSPERLANRFFDIRLDENGEIESIFDKRAGREVIDQSSYCKGNAILSFEDRPLAFDAWDIDIFYNDKMTPVTGLRSIEVVETGPTRASIEIYRPFGAGSTLRQRISIWKDLDRIDFDTEVDWRERQTLLKVAFPVLVHSPRATYDIQFGNVERPTHWNTSWDWARFEVCAHKWADLSEGDYGVSLLSDCKYGWDIKGNVMRLTLLKAAISPDPEADRGRHRFAYALYPHQGDWRDAETVRRAYEFNVPVQFVRGSRPSEGNVSQSMSIVSVDRPNVIIETIKKAENEDAIIVRLYETYGQRGAATLSFGQSVRSIEEVDLMENPMEGASPIAAANGISAEFTYGPYEIKSFRLSFRRSDA
jgi:alpha-mannosidase